MYYFPDNQSNKFPILQSPVKIENIHFPFLCLNFHAKTMFGRSFRKETNTFLAVNTLRSTVVLPLLLLQLP